MAPIAYLQIENLTKSFGDLVLFSGISFGIAEGQRVALIAKNGTGKTTLLNIIASKESYDEGNVTFRKDIKVGYLSQDPLFAEGLTVMEACFASDNEILQTIGEYEKILSLDHTQEQLSSVLAKMEALKAWDYEQKAKQVLSQLKITRFDQPISQLSGGQKKRVALANALITEPDLLILDEPTNHLDVEMTEWLEEYLKKSGITLLMVTHDRYFLDRVCSDIIEIDRKTIYSYKGNYSYYLEKRQERVEQFSVEIEKASNLYKKELDWMRRQPQARATKAKARQDAFYDLEEVVKEKNSDQQVQFGIKATYIGNKIFEAEGLSKQFDDSVTVLKDFTYTFSRYEKLGIIGKNGTGKSSFLKILLGELSPDCGRLEIGETVRFGYYSQDGLIFDQQIKVIDVVRNIAEEISLGDGNKLSASQMLQHFLFTPETQYSYVYKLSGGEKRRLYLCTVLMQNPNFLILDEPTNDLDIVTLNILEEYLQSFQGCVIVVSHDRYFMDKVVDHLFVFQGEGKIKDFPGNYSDYREWREEQTKESRVVAKKTEKETVRVQEKSKAKKLSFKEKKELDEIETDLLCLEQEKGSLTEKMSSGTLSSEELMTVSERMTQIIALLDEKELRWLELKEVEG